MKSHNPHPKTVTPAGEYDSRGHNLSRYVSLCNGAPFRLLLAPTVNQSWATAVIQRYVSLDVAALPLWHFVTSRERTGLERHKGMIINYHSSVSLWVSAPPPTYLCSCLDLTPTAYGIAQSFIGCDLYALRSPDRGAAIEIVSHSVAMCWGSNELSVWSFALQLHQTGVAPIHSRTPLYAPLWFIR